MYSHGITEILESYFIKEVGVTEGEPVLCPEDRHYSLQPIKQAGGQIRNSADEYIYESQFVFRHVFSDAQCLP